MQLYSLVRGFLTKWQETWSWEVQERRKQRAMSVYSLADVEVAQARDDEVETRPGSPSTALNTWDGAACNNFDETKLDLPDLIALCTA